MDGRSQGPAPAVVRNLAAGRHTVRVVPDGDPGASRKEATVRVAPGGSVKKAFTFGRGTLALRVDPWADVRIDGRPVGQTPMPPLSLLEGTHELLLENHELRKKKRVTLVIRAGREQELRIKLDE